MDLKNLQSRIEVFQEEKRSDKKNEQKEAVVVEDRVCGGFEFGDVVFLPESTFKSIIDYDTLNPLKYKKKQN